MAEQAPTIEERMNAYLSYEDAPAPDEQPEAPVRQQVKSPQAEPEQEPEQEPETEAPEVEAQAELETEEDDADAKSIELYNELAEHLGVDVAELYEVSVPVSNPDGTKANISVGKLKDAWQENQKAAKAIKQAQEEYEALNKQRVAAEESIAREASKTASFLNAAKQELTREFNQVNWDQLRAQDPGQYAVKRQDYIERNGRLQSMEQQASRQWDEQQAQVKQQKQEQFGQFAQREQAALVEAIPEWRNEEAANVEKAKLRDYLLNIGYLADEVDHAYDHRTIVLARNAMMWDEQQKQKVVTKKKLKIGKRVLKPGARQSGAQQSQDKVQGLRRNLKKSGRLDDAVALYDATRR